MEIFTIQMGRYRLAKEKKLDFVDTTVKSGLKMFAPTWDMVLGHKNGSVSDEEYTQRYRQMMIESMRENKQAWLEFIERKEPVALACYCKPGVFCHRLLLKDIFAELCKKKEIPFLYYGELTP